MLGSFQIILVKLIDFLLSNLAYSMAILLLLGILFLMAAVT